MYTHNFYFHHNHFLLLLLRLLYFKTILLIILSTLSKIKKREEVSEGECACLEKGNKMCTFFRKLYVRQTSLRHRRRKLFRCQQTGYVSESLYGRLACSNWTTSLYLCWLVKFRHKQFLLSTISACSMYEKRIHIYCHRLTLTYRQCRIKRHE